MGGPGSEGEIYDYLLRLFSDPLIIRLPVFLRGPLARVLAWRRKRKVAARYALIGGKSPLGEETAAQAQDLEAALKFPVTYAMRYTRPFVSSALQTLIDRGVKRLVVLPLYPQYSQATTMSALADFMDHRRPDMPYLFIEEHYNHEPYVKVMAYLLGESLKEADPGLKTTVLFAAHSIPMMQVKDGDPYVEHVKATVASVVRARALLFHHTLAFQSRFGPVKWQGPSLEESLDQLRREQVEQLVVQPISFVSENLETLYDLDIQFKKQCLSAGIKNYIRVPAPGTHPMYIEALASLVRHEIIDWEAHYAR
jgi:ferrochelatase